MDVAQLYDDLLDHLVRTTDLGRSQSARVVAEPSPRVAPAGGDVFVPPDLETPSGP